MRSFVGATGQSIFSRIGTFKTLRFGPEPSLKRRIQTLRISADFETPSSRAERSTSANNRGLEEIENLVDFGLSWAERGRGRGSRPRGRSRRERTVYLDILRRIGLERSRLGRLKGEELGPCDRSSGGFSERDRISIWFGTRFGETTKFEFSETIFGMRASRRPEKVRLHRKIAKVCGRNDPKIRANHLGFNYAR